MRQSFGRGFDWRSGLFYAAFALSLLLGGGGAEGPLNNGLIAGLGALLLGILLVDQVTGRRVLPLAALLPITWVGLLLLVVLLQVIPASASSWQALPGRELMRITLGQIGQSNTPRAISIDPQATALWATALLMPLAIMLRVLREDARGQRAFLLVFIGCAFVSGIIGALQLAFGHPDLLSFYEGPSRGAASGAFANPNHQGLFMILAAIACAMWGSPSSHLKSESPSRLALAIAGMFFFTLMALASGSRSSILLLAIAMPSALLLRKGYGSALRWSGGMAAFAGLLALVILLYPGTNSLGLRESFAFADDSRAASYPDLLFTLKQYWPAGSGFGTFTTAYLPNEDLDLAGRAYLNHAHNDYLEFVIEAGALGAVLLLLGGALLLWASLRSAASGPDFRKVALGALLMILAIALHSTADYPLRTSSVAVVFALAIGVLLRRPSVGQPTSKSTQATGRLAKSPWIAVCVVALVTVLPIAVQAVRLNLITWSLREDRLDVAASLGSRDATVLANEAQKHMRGGNLAAAEQMGVQAIDREPMNIIAVRTLAQVREAQQRDSSGLRTAAALLGWRDPETQFWAFSNALRGNEPSVAAIRVDALLRTSEPPPGFVRAVRVAAVDPAFRSALIERLELEPHWAPSFFAVPLQVDPRELAGVVQTLKQWAAKQGNIEPRFARAAIGELIRRSDYTEAQILHRSARNKHPTPELIADKGFDFSPDEYLQDASMLDWRTLQSRGVASSIDPSPPRLLVIETDGGVTRAAADIHLPLPAGRYRMAYRYRSDAPEAAGIRVTCLGSKTPLAEFILAEAQQLEQRAVTFTVTEGCGLAQLAVMAKAGEQSSMTEIDEISLQRAGAAD